MDKKRSKSNKLRTPKRFRLTFINENSYNEVWTIKMSQAKVTLSIIAIIVAIACIVSTIIVLTPIRTLLPGYLKISQRQENVLNSMRIDSLLTEMNIHNAYLNNINNILTNNIDSIKIAPPDTSAQIIPIDSIMDASNIERQFIQQYEEQERFNLSVLAPIAAEGMMFYTPVASATISETNQLSHSITITAPALSSISTIYNGTVVDTYYTPSTGTVVTIQHPNDFISKYSGIGEIFISKGDKVSTGQRIGITPQRKSVQQPPLTLELWHNGTALSPLNYIAF